MELHGFATSGVEVMVKLGPDSRVSVDSGSYDGGLPILEILAGYGVNVMITPWVGVEQSGQLTRMDLLVADELVRTAERYRNDLARALGEPEV